MSTEKSENRRGSVFKILCPETSFILKLQFLFLMSEISIRIHPKMKKSVKMNQRKNSENTTKKRLQKNLRTGLQKNLKNLKTRLENTLKTRLKTS